MANNYYQATGSLKLNQITPVINALFGVFNVEEIDNETAYIKQDEGDCTSHEAVAEQICLVMEVAPGDDSFACSLRAMADKVGKYDEVSEYLSQSELEFAPDDSCDLNLLYDLARIMDDGHGLSSLQISGAWTCDKMRLGEFGGDATYIGNNFTLRTGTYIAENLGEFIDRAIGEGDFVKVQSRIFSDLHNMLSGVSNETVRENILAGLANLMQPGRAQSDKEVVVVMEGGIVQNVLSATDDFSVAVIDYDKQAHIDSGILIPQDNGEKAFAYGAIHKPEVIDKSRVSALFDAVNDPVTIGNFEYSLLAAKKIAAKMGKVVVLDSGKNLELVGKYLGMTDYHLVASDGRQGVVVESGLLSMKAPSISPGDMVSISIKDGKRSIEAVTKHVIER